MSDKPIQVGDLVVMVRGHECTLAKYGGIPWRVAGLINQTGGGWGCGICGARNLASEALYAAQKRRMQAFNGIPTTWLKRIPPLSELEGERTQEDMKEPA